MNRIVKTIWLLTLSLCLVITASTAIGSMRSAADCFEEISLEVIEFEVSEQILERRRAKHLPPAVAHLSCLPSSICRLNKATDLNVTASERTRLNGFGGYQLI